jgi:acetoacetyl-CoA synthetase
MLAYSETRAPMTLSHAEVNCEVARVASALRRLGVRRGDRVAAYIPNIPEAAVAFLASAAVGAIWSS